MNVDGGEGSLPTKIFTEFTKVAFDEIFSTNKELCYSKYQNS